MKKTYTLLLAAFFTISSFAQLTYPGNGNNSSGGEVGLGGLALSNDDKFLHLTFTKGSESPLTGVFVMYIQTTRGISVKSTADLNDLTDQLTQAICGQDGLGNTAPIDFAAGFRPGFAIAFRPGTTSPKVTVAELTNGGSFLNIAHPDITPNNDPTSPTFDLDVKLNDMGIKPLLGDAIQFNFLVYYMDAGGRSNEAIGDLMTGFTPGWNGYSHDPGEFLQYSATLPVVFGDFTGAFAGKNVQLNWNTKTEINTKLFDVQKSGDGAAWRSIATMPTQNSATGAHYSYLDNNVADAVTYYRIKLTDIDEAISYSPVIIMRKDAVSGITLLGNPARGVINLNINNTNTGKYNIELYSVDGRRIASQVYNHTGGSGKVSIAVPGEVRGTCVVKITNGTEKQSMKVVVQ